MGGTSDHLRTSRLKKIRKYNNVAQWKYCQLLEVFGANNPRTFQVEKKQNLTNLLANKEFSESNEIQVYPNEFGSL